MTNAETRGEHRELLMIDKVYDLFLWSRRWLADDSGGIIR